MRSTSVHFIRLTKALPRSEYGIIFLLYNGTIFNSLKNDRFVLLDIKSTQFNNKNIVP